MNDTQPCTPIYTLPAQPGASGLLENQMMEQQLSEVLEVGALHRGQMQMIG